MTTADMSLKVDPKYKLICERFLENPEEFGETFARAWFKLLHRDMGPKSNYVSGDYKDVEYIWQDPTPTGKLLTSNEEDVIRKTLSDSDLSIQEMVNTALSSAITFRGSDNRGGANGSRIRLEPQKNWDVNKPHELEKVLNVYEKIADKYNQCSRCNCNRWCCWY